MPVGLLTYTVVDGVNVVLRLTVGDGQPGGIAIVVDGMVKWQGPGMTFPADGVTLGRGERLRGSRVVATAVVQADMVQTRHCSVSATFLGGAAAKTATFTQDAREPGEKIGFTIVAAFN
jgi:hypothetical protein